jgi:hypothetical protein
MDAAGMYEKSIYQGQGKSKHPQIEKIKSFPKK